MAAKVVSKGVGRAKQSKIHVTDVGKERRMLPRSDTRHDATVEIILDQVDWFALLGRTVWEYRSKVSYPNASFTMGSEPK